MNLLTTQEVAAELKMSQRFVLDELRRKRLRGSKMGGEWRVSESDLSRYVEALANVSNVGRSA